MITIPAPSKKTVENILRYAPEFLRLKTSDDQDIQQELSQFLAAVYATDFMISFDWMSEFSTALDRMMNPDVLITADASQLRKLLIANLRFDRFCNGHLEWMLRSGYLESGLTRLRALLPTLK